VGGRFRRRTVDSRRFRLQPFPLSHCAPFCSVCCCGRNRPPGPRFSLPARPFCSSLDLPFLAWFPPSAGPYVCVNLTCPTTSAHSLRPGTAQSEQPLRFASAPIFPRVPTRACGPTSDRVLSPGYRRAISFGPIFGINFRNRLYRLYFNRAANPTALEPEASQVRGISSAGTDFAHWRIARPI